MKWLLFTCQHVVVDKHTMGEMYDWLPSGMNKSLNAVQQRHFFVLN